MKTRIFGLLLLIFLVRPAHAELPDYVLDRDYQNCVGEDKDPNRAAYCDCVRKGMKQWDDSAYSETAMQAAAVASNPNVPPPVKVEDLAKQCITQVLQ